MRDLNDKLTAEIRKQGQDLEKANFIIDKLTKDAESQKEELDSKFESLHQASSALDVKSREIDELNESRNRIEEEFKNLHSEYEKLLEHNNSTTNMLETEQRKFKLANEELRIADAVATVGRVFIATAAAALIVVKGRISPWRHRTNGDQYAALTAAAVVGLWQPVETRTKATPEQHATAH